MSDQEDTRREADKVRVGRIAATGFVGLFLFGVGAVWAASLQVGATGSVRSGSGSKPEHVGEPEVGIVYQRPFNEGVSRDPAGIASTRSLEARRRLQGTGWVDQDAGLAHIPIDQAMDLIVQRGAL